MKPQTRPFKAGSQEKLFPERGHDAYKLQHKLREPTVCPTCGAVYQEGRWQWGPRPSDADEVVCSACHRIADREPAGFVYIEGEFATQHRDELVHLLRHHEEHARAEHAMERIIAIEDESGKAIVTTTGVHLARDLGSALKAAFQGTLELKYSKDENLLRAYWRR
ncbi:BCAM0308 family protein [Paraburkholderia kururiensis]|uniref:BCAM0308 family protein n=1 Tax=Paraburkholderia kururiensis TaxID=984307 RepID=UPI0005A96A65|nr:BCAM0308 family protein [Paraburkholderia kururiensis]